jgi:predicted PurR-regulated permease PerM
VEKRFDALVWLVAVVMLAAGCWLVLRPFLTAILFAAVVCVSTWPLYTWLLRRLKGRRGPAAMVMTLSLMVTVVLPLALVAYSLASDVAGAYAEASTALAAGPPQPPAWLIKLPWVGAAIEEYWRHTFASRDELVALAGRILEPAKGILLAGGTLLGNGVIVMSLAAFISFFFYRDGEALRGSLETAMARVAGSDAPGLLDTITDTVRSVAYGLLGTALAQAVAMAIGLAIAGVPAVLPLAVATVLLSVAPIGPPLIWGGAALWLFHQGATAWGVFMLLWGLVLVSGADNVVKPLLMSRGSSLPFVLVFLGALGGVLAFGFVGIFIGPMLLAVGFNLTRKWTARNPAPTAG